MQTINRQHSGQDMAFRTFTWVLLLTTGSLVLAWASFAVASSAPPWLALSAISLAAGGWLAGVSLIAREVLRRRL